MNRWSMLSGSVLLVVLAALGLSLAPVSGTAATATPSESATATITLEVSLADRALRVREGEKTIATYPIAVGKQGHATPTGSFRVRRIIWNPSWVPPNEPWAKDRKPAKPGDPHNPMGRVKIFFSEPDYYIHGTEDGKSIGRAASHGCIRMKNDDVIALARLLMQRGGQPRDPGWFRRVINRVTETREVRLTAPVQMRIRRS